MPFSNNYLIVSYSELFFTYAQLDVLIAKFLPEAVTGRNFINILFSFKAIKRSVKGLELTLLNIN